MTTSMVRTPRRRPVFHPLGVAEVEELTADSVAITFDVPERLRSEFEFSPGQHVTVRRHGADGVEVRRSYSLCSTPDDLRERGLVRIGVRLRPGGAFSEYARGELRVGDSVEVLAPLGHFTTGFDAGRARRYVALVAGSGITPVLSLFAAGLRVEPLSTFTLVFGNRGAANVMFAEELADLKDRYPQRLQVLHVLSREPGLSDLATGRVDADRLRMIFDGGLIEASTVDEWFLCGPYAMVQDARAVLADRAGPTAAIHTELFHVDGVESGAATRVAAGAIDGPSPTADQVDVVITLDGRESTFAMSRDGRVLDAALGVRGELPYACKGGVCSTCRARLVEGEVTMANNYVLEPDELAAGYILTCQSTPVSDRLVVDYDA